MTLRLAFVALFATSAFAAADLTDAQKERFLQEGEIVSARKLDIGVTGSREVMLTDGVLSHRAHFQDVDEYRAFFRSSNRSEANFRDSYRYNIAAYRLDRMLDLNMTPVSVERKYEGQRGALTWWVDGVQMMETERRSQGILPPDQSAWGHQVSTAWLFQELIHNTDPNPGNMLIGEDWSLWLIDFTRAFRLSKRLRRPENVPIVVHRRLWERLLALDEAGLREAMHGILLKAEVQGILGRRDLIVQRLRERIALRGEAAVIREN